MRNAFLFIAVVGFLFSSSLTFPQRSTPDPCSSGHEFGTTDCALTWHGFTLYGAYDIGVGWVSHGLPENGYNYEGASLVNRNGYQHRFLIAPNNLQQTGLGIRGKEEFRPGWYVVFNASTGINPQSGRASVSAQLMLDATTARAASDQNPSEHVEPGEY